MKYESLSFYKGRDSYSMSGGDCPEAYVLKKVTGEGAKTFRGYLTQCLPDCNMEGGLN